MRVWLDDDLCTGCGCCTMICEEVFGRSEQDLAVVLENGVPLPSMEPARVPQEFESRVVEAAEHCPGEIIWIER